jgi:hypothetical protein
MYYVPSRAVDYRGKVSEHVHMLRSVSYNHYCGSGIRCLFDQDPGSGIGFFRDPGSLTHIFIALISVGDRDLDPHVFDPPGSGSGSFPSSHKCAERIEIMPSNKILG